MWIRTYTFIIYKTFPEDESLLSSSLVFLSRIMPILVNPILSFNLRLCVFIFYKEFAFLSIQCAFYRGFVHVTLLHSLSLSLSLSLLLTLRRGRADGRLATGPIIVLWFGLFCHMSKLLIHMAPCGGMFTGFCIMWHGSDRKHSFNFKITNNLNILVA